MKTAEITREAHIIEWTQTKKEAIDCAAIIRDNALANGKTVNDPDVKVAWDAVQNVIRIADENLHPHFTMTLPTAQMVADRTARSERDLVGEGVCPFCRGTGYIAEYSHIANGICFRCDGEG